MPEVTKRRTGEFLRKAFEFLLDQQEGVNAGEILKKIGETFKFTEYEAGTYPSSPGEYRYEKIIRFASIDLVKAGWMIKDKGKWFITDLGKEAYKKYKDPEEFYKEATRLYSVWKKKQPNLGDSKNSNIKTIDLAISIEKAEEQSRNEIIEFIKSIEPFEFQKLVEYLLRAMKYHVVWNSPPGKDQGVDIIAFNDPLGTSNPRIKVQVKHREGSTSVEQLRSFIATLGTDDVGIFVSTGGFTNDARIEARTKDKKITLINIDKLLELWIENYGKLSQEAKQKLPLKPIYFLDLDE